MKVKVGIEPDGDVARVRAVREAIGPNVRLGVDANGGWSPRVAIQTIRRMYEFGIYSRSSQWRRWIVPGWRT